MITVSEAWKNAHKGSLLPETYIEITYAATEPGLQLDATAEGSLEESFSAAETLVSSSSAGSEKYATLELNSWGLDGSFEYLNDSLSAPGYVTTSQSGDDTAYAELPTVTITFSKLHTEPIPGITITWADVFSEWATKFRVTAYNDENQVAQITVLDNASIVSYVWVGLENYNRLVIEVLEWCLPNRRARVSGIYMGIRNIYTKSDLLGFSHKHSVDLLSAALPKNEITFRLRNEDDRWNPDNPTSVEQYLMQRQEIRVRYGLDVSGTIEWIDAGQFWLSEWNTPSNGIEVTFSARDLIGFMGEKYTGIKDGTLYDIAIAAFEQADLPLTDGGEPRYQIDTILKEYSTNFVDDYTISEILQMVSHLGCCVLYQSRDGIVHIESPSDGVSDYEITQDVSYTHPEIDLTKPLKAVTASYGDGFTATVTVGTSGEVQTVDNPLTQSETDALRVAQRTADVLKGRKIISGEYRADPRLDALDIVKIHSKYATNTVVISDIEYTTTGGAMRGVYTGRVI